MFRPATFAGSVASSNARRIARLATVPVRHASERIPAAEMFALWAHVVQERGDNVLPLRAARDFRLEELGLLGLVLLCAPTGLAALEAFCDLNPLLNDGRLISLVHDARVVTMVIHDPSPLTLGVRLSHETTLAHAAVGMRELIGASGRPLGVELRHGVANKPTVSAFRAFFDCPVQLDARRDAIRFSRDALSAPRPAAHKAVWQHIYRQAEDELDGLRLEKTLTADVQLRISKALGEGERPSLSSTAARLACSERTLRRGLAREGTSFRALLEDAQRLRAAHYLSQRSDSVTRIALELGFADASAFTHACRRWFGRTPSALRAQAE